MAMKNNIDITNLFITDMVFRSRDDLIKWARDVGKQSGFVVVIIRSDNGGLKRKTMLILGCERSGKYRQYKNELMRKVTGTKKCECPFRLRGRPLTNGEGWKLKVVCGSHNHDLSQTLEGHPYAGRLSGEEKSLLVDMTKNMIKPKDILLTLKDRNEHCVTSIKQIYNVRQAYRRGESHRTKLQDLIKLLERDNYVCWYRNEEMSDAVRDILWTHPDSIKLLNAFHIVLMIDTTCKTNKYQLPLLEIMGVTSTELSFFVGFALLDSERVDNFKWMLQKLRGLYLKDDLIPQVIVTDRHVALMNAVEAIFPKSTHLICQFHVSKNVKEKCKLLVSSTDEWDSIMDSWMSILDSPKEFDYEQRWSQFKDACSSVPMFVDYVEKTWLVPYKEKFVTCWVNKVMHLGNTTTNRVETAHSRLKTLLKDSGGDLCSCWDAMNNMIMLQHSEIKASFEESMIIAEHRFNKDFYEKLRGLISKNALAHIATEFERVKFVKVDSSSCGCSLRITHGLPCACELARYNMMGVSVPLECVHPHWKILTFVDQGVIEPFSEVTLQPEMEALQKQFNELDRSGKIRLKNKLRELVFLDTTSMYLPLENVRATSMYLPLENVRAEGAPESNALKHEISTKCDLSFFEDVEALDSDHDSTSPELSMDVKQQSSKRIKKMPLLDQFPIQLHDYIEHIVDVKADGNCGYRCIAALLGKGEEAWAQVRLDLLRELGQYRSLYVRLFGTEQRWSQLRSSLLLGSEPMVSSEKWMTLPDMGFVIASKYNVVLVQLSMLGCMTFFPLRGEPPSNTDSHRVMCIGLVHNYHFVEVFLAKNSPIPPTALQWQQYCDDGARLWEFPYIPRMQIFNSLFPDNVQQIVGITGD